MKADQKRRMSVQICECPGELAETEDGDKRLSVRVRCLKESIVWAAWKSL